MIEVVIVVIFRGGIDWECYEADFQGAGNVPHSRVNTEVKINFPVFELY